MAVGRSASLLGAYILPGPAEDPRLGREQTLAAERLGLGSAWISELQGPTKDAGAISGYMAALTSRITVGASITHFGTRNPVIVASWGATMQMLTNGRFVLGFGRSVPYRFASWGVRVPTLRSMADEADIIRRLWRGETVTYSGPAGDYPAASILPATPGVIFPDIPPPPIMLAAVGPKTLALAGQHFDGVFLHGFLTTDTVAQSCSIVAQAAEAAGRDPRSVPVYAEVVCAPDFDADEIDLVVGARLAAYCSAPDYGEMPCRANHWDPAPMAPLREAVAQAHADNERNGGRLRGRELFRAAGRLLPREWLATGAALGSTAEAAARLHDYLDAGASYVRVHGITPERLEPMVAAFEAHGIS